MGDELEISERPGPPERTGWRDQGLSERHRQWGYNLPALDLDFLLLEYDHEKAIALVEYKHARASRIKLGHPSYRALVDLGDRADLPVFIVRYTDDFRSWNVTPLNRRAAALCSVVQYTERQWFDFLRRLRTQSHA